MQAPAARSASRRGSGLVIPAWTIDAAISLAKAAANLLNAPTDDARRAVLMDAAEELKAHLDREKFGGG